MMSLRGACFCDVAAARPRLSGMLCGHVGLIYTATEAMYNAGLAVTYLSSYICGALGFLI